MKKRCFEADFPTFDFFFSLLAELRKSSLGNPLYANEGLKKEELIMGVILGDLSKSLTHLLLLLFVLSPVANPHMVSEQQRGNPQRFLFFLF